MARQRTRRMRYLLRTLNIFGLDHLDPVILAALADAQPLLLIGTHGTAKSELLNRIAGALGLEHRHYNASLISFDDLLGYPVPNKARTGLDYLRTPADLWDAESVFLDEISRCRPEHQNKLFSIVHERRVQGLPLEKLRYRWSAMNPPMSLDGDDEYETVYKGSLPLDTALADRFAYIALVPDFTAMGVRDRKRILREGGNQPQGDAGLEALIHETGEWVAGQGEAESKWVRDYVAALVAPLRDARLTISGRRAVVLTRAVNSVCAACHVLRRDETLADAAFIALKWGLPQRAQGKSIQESKLLAVHRAAVKVAGEPGSGVWQAIRNEADPVRRVVLALAADERAVSRIELSQLVTDAWAGLALPERYIFARHLLPAMDSDRLTVSTYEILMEPMARMLAFTERDEHQLNIPRSQASAWDRLVAAVNRIRRERGDDGLELCNLLYTLFVVENERFDPDKLIGKDTVLEEMFHGRSARQAA